jgi:hypothetical protein
LHGSNRLPERFQEKRLASLCAAQRDCVPFPVRKRDKSTTYRAFSDFEQSEKAPVRRFPAETVLSQKVASLHDSVKEKTRIVTGIRRSYVVEQLAGVGLNSRAGP